MSFIIVAIFAFLITPLKHKYTIVVFSSLVVITVMLLMLAFGGSEFRGLSFGQSDDVSYFIRLDMFAYCRFIISNFPGGIGVGNFSFMNFTYPHNIIVEIFVEWGWLYGTAFTIFLTLGGLGLFRAGSNVHILLMLFIFDLVNALASGDITSPRMLYGLSILGIAFLANGQRDLVRPAKSEHNIDSSVNVGGRFA